MSKRLYRDMMRQRAGRRNTVTRDIRRGRNRPDGGFGEAVLGEFERTPEQALFIRTRWIEAGVLSEWERNPNAPAAQELASNSNLCGLRIDEQRRVVVAVATEGQSASQ